MMRALGGEEGEEGGDRNERVSHRVTPSDSGIAVTGLAGTSELEVVSRDLEPPELVVASWRPQEVGSARLTRCASGAPALPLDPLSNRPQIRPTECARNCPSQRALLPASLLSLPDEFLASADHALGR